LIAGSSNGHRNGLRPSSISVVVVNHNTCRELRACLGSITPEETNDVVVIDNKSSDGSLEMVRSEYPSVRLLANESNIGYGAAANLAIAELTTPYVVLLNSDTLLRPGACKALCRYLDEHPRAAIVGPRLENSTGRLEASCFPFPGPINTFLENSVTAVLLGRLIRQHVPVIRGLYLRTWPHDSARIVPWVKGAALAIRRKAFVEVGGFDQRFFMYFEDADLCCRLGKVGWEVHFAPVTTIVHSGAASTRNYRADMAVQLLHSTELFYEKHCSRFRTTMMKWVIKSLMLAKLFFSSIRLLLLRDPSRRRLAAEDISISQRVLFRTKHGHRN
jgi:GT2 family glycosyltransferase